jgi:hypothetical protein
MAISYGYSNKKEQKMNKPITPEQMSEWVAKTWKECQERAWSNTPSLDSDTIRSYNMVIVTKQETK